MAFDNPPIPQQEYTEHLIDGCLFRLLPGVALPKIRYTRKPKGGLTLGEIRALHRNKAIKDYLFWYYPKETRAIEGWCDVKTLKDETTGKPRFVRLIWDRKYAIKGRQKASSKTLTLEIPHWDYDPEIIEERTDIHDLI